MSTESEFAELPLWIFKLSLLDKLDELLLSSARWLERSSKFIPFRFRKLEPKLILSTIGELLGDTVSNSFSVSLVFIAEAALSKRVIPGTSLLINQNELAIVSLIPPLIFIKSFLFFFSTLVSPDSCVLSVKLLS